MSPHRALCVAELLILVFEKLRKSDLARCARTCRLFANLAMDILWRDLDLLPQLRAIMPPGLLLENGEHVS